MVADTAGICTGRSCIRIERICTETLRVVDTCEHGSVTQLHAHLDSHVLGIFNHVERLEAVAGAEAS